VLALPRGGVPVAFEVARGLHAPLDIFLVRKLGLPGHEELAIGAIATGGVRVVNDAGCVPFAYPTPSSTRSRWQNAESWIGASGCTAVIACPSTCVAAR